MKFVEIVCQDEGEDYYYEYVTFFVLHGESGEHDDDCWNYQLVFVWAATIVILHKT